MGGADWTPGAVHGGGCFCPASSVEEIESLADVVEQIPGFPPRETLSDRVDLELGGVAPWSGNRSPGKPGRHLLRSGRPPMTMVRDSAVAMMTIAPKTLA